MVGFGESAAHRDTQEQETPRGIGGWQRWRLRWAPAVQGIGGGVYFKVYGKRLEPALGATDNTPHPLRKWGGEQQGCG